MPEKNNFFFSLCNILAIFNLHWQTLELFRKPGLDKKVTKVSIQTETADAHLHFPDLTLILMLTKCKKGNRLWRG